MSHTNTKSTKSGAGFTIIEVLIVLAIAGLILLIVFLAVPALQRNSRNTSIKNDVQNVLGGVSEFEGANNGTPPSNVAGTGDISYTKTGLNTTKIKVQGSTNVTTATSGVPATTNTVTPGDIKVYIGKRCDGATSSRAIAAEYAIETSGNAAVYQCQDS